MGSPEKITATAEGNLPWLERALNRLLRCSHRHRTSPMTLKGETFATCLDCGGRVPYSLDALRAGLPGKKAVGKIPVAKQPRTTINSKLIHSTLRKWTREGVWLGLLAAGFAGGIFYSGQRQPITPSHAATLEPRAANAEVTAIPAALPDVAGSTAAPVAGIHRPMPTPRLESDGRAVVLAREAATALDVAEHPGKLAELIQSGSLFTVSRGTPVRVVERKQSVVRVVITAGSLAGQEAWVLTSRVSSE